jgi:hypothetical protein
MKVKHWKPSGFVRQPQSARVWDADLGTPSWSPLCREIVEVLVRMSGASGVARRR